MLSTILLQGDLPQHLVPRTTSHSVLVLVLFAFSIFLVALARLRERNVFLFLLQGVFFFKPLDDLSKDAYKATSMSALLFVVQFFVVSAGVLYWFFFQHQQAGSSAQNPLLLLLLLVPTVYFLYQSFMIAFIARISGNAAIVEEINYFSSVLTQFTGLLFLVEFFISYFQPEYLLSSAKIMGITYLAYLVLRFLRGFWIGVGKGIAWYYIILYFCTLEILPLLIVSKLLFHEVISKLMYYDKFQAWIG